MKGVFGMAPGQTAGFAERLRPLAGPDRSVPDFSTLSHLAHEAHTVSGDRPDAWP